jgi:hypothetical protein
MNPNHIRSIEQKFNTVQWSITMRSIYTIIVHYTYIPSCWSHYDINFLENLQEVMHNSSSETDETKFRSYMHNNFKYGLHLNKNDVNLVHL